MSDDDILITGSKIEGARWLAVRSALKLEIAGMRRSRGASARQLANEITGHNHKRARDAYVALNLKIVEAFGPEFNRPLPTTDTTVTTDADAPEG